ncbi:MAG: MOSC domain-containing protein [Pseudomonadota bacterium]
MSVGACCLDRIAAGSQGRYAAHQRGSDVLRRLERRSRACRQTGGDLDPAGTSGCNWLLSPVNPETLRRNLVVAGINLAALKGREVQVGEAILRFTVICAPCSRMEEALGKGGYSAVRGHGGWCAEVVHPGRIRLGDAVQPVD